MKAKFIIPFLCALPMMANAAIPYRVEQVKMPDADAPAGLDNEALARMRRFYVGGAYNFAMWQDYTDENDQSVTGKNTSGFDVMLGLRVYDTFRVELDYTHTDAKWQELNFQTDSFMVNAILDARIDNIYRLFRTQMIVPYVGVGAGLSWNKAGDGVSLDKKIAPSVAALAGFAIEFNDIFALDLGYKYFYMFKPEADVMPDLNPAAHQFRAGARISF